MHHFYFLRPNFLKPFNRIYPVATLLLRCCNSQPLGQCETGCFIEFVDPFVGILLLILVNGLHGTLPGVRREIEQLGTFEMFIVISAFLYGFWRRADVGQILFDALECSCLCGTGVLNFCDFDHLFSRGASYYVDVWPIINWILFLR